MAVFKEWPGIRYIMQLIIMNLVSCLACLSAIAFAQLEFSEAVTGSVSFPDGAIACIGNLAVFFTILLRRRLDLENGARDVLATNRGPKLQKIKESGLTTCNEENYKSAKVVMLSKDPSNSNSISQFMKYVRHSYGVQSILLKCRPFAESRDVTDCDDFFHSCDCLELWTEEEGITMMIARRMPGTLKRLSKSCCLLPCSYCLESGCHGCNRDLLYAKQTQENSKTEFSHRYYLYHHLRITYPHLQIPLQSAVVTAELCCDQFHECRCNVLWTEEEEIRKSFSSIWKPKRLSNSLCLLPSSQCLRRGCHGLLQTEDDSKEESPEIHGEPVPERASVEEESTTEIVQRDVEKTHEEERLTEEGPKAESPSAICQMLGDYQGLRNSCICIPLYEAGNDEWTKLIIRFLRSKDNVAREVRVMVNDAMEKYIDGSGEIWRAEENYSRWSLIVPRLMEVSLNIVLAGWLRVDGLSSSLIARRVVRDHLVDSKGTGFNANAFLTKAEVQCNQSSVCQLLEFRGKILGVRTLSYVVGSVNLICAMSWCVLMACNGRYGIHSMPTVEPRIVVMLTSIGVALLMDFVELILGHLIFGERSFGERAMMKMLRYLIFPERVMVERVIVWAVIILQIGYIVSGSVIVAKGMGTGKWVYSVFQALIWVKWGIASYLLGDRFWVIVMIEWILIDSKKEFLGICYQICYVVVEL